MKFPKSKRFKSEENLNLVRNQKCIVCGHPPPNDPAHIRTIKSGGGDELWNLMALDRQCHSLQHWIGIESFIKKFDLPIAKIDGWYRRTDIK